MANPATLIKSLANEDSERIREALREYKQRLISLLWYAETLDKALDDANVRGLGVINFAQLKLNEVPTFESLIEIRAALEKRLQDTIPEIFKAENN